MYAKRNVSKDNEYIYPASIECKVGLLKSKLRTGLFRYLVKRVAFD